MTEIDHEYTERIICPYCGHAESAGCEYEVFSRGQECVDGIYCGSCEKTFSAIRHISVRYSTCKEAQDAQ